MVLVTGATGLVGSHLIYKLASNGVAVRGLYRREKKLVTVKKVFSYYTQEVEAVYNHIDWVEGDITDIPALRQAFQDIKRVYHCAAFVSFEPDKYHQLRKINIEGTANVVNLCISEGIEKLCYVSSIAAIGNHPNPDHLITETTPWQPEADNSVYAITKFGAELEVWRGSQEGLKVIIVNPGIIIGPGYWHHGGSSSLFKSIFKGMSHYTTGITGYVDVYDCVEAMLKLMRNDIKNEAYILVAENLSFQEFQTKVAAALNVSPPKKRATPFLLAVAWRLDWLGHALLGKRRKLSKQMAKSAQTKTVYDASKITNSIDFSFNDLNVSIAKTADLFLKDLP